MNITLFGSSEDLYVYDGEGIPLDTVEIGEYTQVNTLGADTIEAVYLTSDLTGKTGAIWRIEVETPISSEVILPLSSTIINLNEIPLEIDTVGEQTRLVMPAGLTVVSYTVDIQDSEELAQEEIDTAEDEIIQAKANGVIVTTAEELIAEAKTAQAEEDYLTAQEKAAEARLEVETLVHLWEQSSEKISNVEEAAQTAEENGRTIGLETAESILEEASTLHEAGEYTQAIEKADSAMLAVLAADAPESGNQGTLMLAAAGIVVIGVAAFILGRRREPAPVVENITVDLELLFEEHPELRIDDREALRYMAEHGGEAFAHEIRERFDIPRTSAWRMIQRLQRFEVIEERKIGGQSLVTIVERYRRRGT